MVIVKKLDSVSYRFNWVLQTLMDKNGQVDLLISPVDFKQRLEPSEELSHFIKSTINNVLDNLLLLVIKLVLIDPGERIKVLLVMLLPDIANDIIPLF